MLAGELALARVDVAIVERRESQTLAGSRAGGLHSRTIDIAAWAERVRLIDARYAGLWQLPVLGAVPAPTAILIRPDGHVAWIGDGTDHGLHDALTRWFGPPDHG